MDFTFLYLGDTDAVGHNHGWMSDKYMISMEQSWENIARLTDALPDDYTVIITADHGGHDRTHGTDLPEDMTIPVCFCGPRFEKGRELDNVSIKDVAVTFAALLDVPPAKEWEGTSILGR